MSGIPEKFFVKGNIVIISSKFVSVSLQFTNSLLLCKDEMPPFGPHKQPLGLTVSDKFNFNSKHHQFKDNTLLHVTPEEKLKVEGNP